MGSAYGSTLDEVQHARGNAAAIELADAEGADVALHDAPRCHDVRAKVDERRDDPVTADCLDEGVGGETVLHGQHVAVGDEPGAKQLCGSPGVQALDSHDGVRDAVGQILGGDRVRGHSELVDRAFDDETVFADGGDVCLVGVAQSDVVAGADHVGAQRSADRARADDGDFHKASFIRSRYDAVTALSRKSRTVDRNSSRSSICGE